MPFELGALCLLVCLILFCFALVRQSLFNSCDEAAKQQVIGARLLEFVYREYMYIFVFVRVILSATLPLFQLFY